MRAAQARRPSACSREEKSHVLCSWRHAAVRSPLVSTTTHHKCALVVVRPLLLRFMDARGKAKRLHGNRLTLPFVHSTLQMLRFRNAPSLFVYFLNSY